MSEKPVMLFCSKGYVDIDVVERPNYQKLIAMTPEVWEQQLRDFVEDFACNDVDHSHVNLKIAALKKELEI